MQTEILLKYQQILNKMALNPSEGWKYYNELSVSGAISDYQMKLDIRVGSSSNNDPANGIIYDDGHCYYSTGSDVCKDHRFGSSCDPSTATQLYEWAESITTDVGRVVWVNISSYSKIYLFAGNSFADEYSDGDNTFLFFDDFLGTSLNITKWNTNIGSKGSYSINNKLTESVTDTASNGGFIHIYSVSTYPVGTTIWELKYGTHSGSGADFSLATCIETPTASDPGWVDAYRFNPYWYRSEYRIVKDVNGSGSVVTDGGTVADNKILGGWWENTGSEKLYIDRAITLSGTDSDLTNQASYFDMYFTTGNTGETASIDIYWALVRKYSSSEPSWSFGIWRSLPIPIKHAFIEGYARRKMKTIEQIDIRNFVRKGY